MATTINEIFYLRSVSPQTTQERLSLLLSAQINNDLTYILSYLPKIKIQAEEKILSTNIPQKIKQYEVPELHIESSGVKSFKHFDKNGGVMCKGGRCDYCKRDFDHEIIGYPTKMEEKLVLVNGVKQIITSYFTEGEFDTYNCALAYLNKFNYHSVTKCDVNVLDSKYLLYQMFENHHPQKSLIAAPNPSLLESNGGSVSDNDWCNDSYCYNRSESVITVPIKVEYVRTSYHPNDVQFVQNINKFPINSMSSMTTN